MIAEYFDQGSDEWHSSRVGIPTASVFDKIATTKGEPSASAQKLLYQLAGERLLGKKEESYVNGAMLRGTELEAEARILFQMQTGLEVEQVGICYYDENRDRGCSPDGLIVGKKEGLEIKCPSLAVHVEYLLDKKLPTTYFQQVQGSLYITGYDRWHFFSYYPGLPPCHVVVERDEAWIIKFGKILDNFVSELARTHIRLVNG